MCRRLSQRLRGAPAFRMSLRWRSETPDVRYHGPDPNMTGSVEDPRSWRPSRRRGASPRRLSAVATSDFNLSKLSNMHLSVTGMACLQAYSSQDRVLRRGRARARSVMRCGRSLADGSRYVMGAAHEGYTKVRQNRVREGSFFWGGYCNSNGASPAERNSFRFRTHFLCQEHRLERQQWE
jgi:hypothetical protein